MNNIPDWVVFHLPHDSCHIPESVRGQFCFNGQELKSELVRMTDHHTRDLFLGGIHAENVVCASVSRLVVDVERFENDEDEPMAAMGMGVIYTLTSDQKPLRRPISEQERQTLLNLYYRPHHEELNRVVENVLASHGHCLVVDCHSFPSVPLVCDLDKRTPRPDICIGTDAFHTPVELAERFVRAFKNAGFEVAVDRPFSGALVPSGFCRCDQRVSSIMVEINRRLYCDENTGERLNNFAAVASKISACCLSAICGRHEIYSGQGTMTMQDKQGWSGRFSEPVAELVKRYTASVDFDNRLALFDIQGSLAHAQMLAACNIISAQDLSDIRRGMAQIESEIICGEFIWSLDLEDVHRNIETRLIELVGDAGKRLHTGRSRNDQVATDMRLYLRYAIGELRALIHALQTAIVDLSAHHTHTIMPGFTHLQVAQPVSFAHHLLAYFEMLKRDAERLADCRKRVNRLPLGAAALAGTSYPIKREYVAELLGFDGVCENSLDAVSDRDFAIEFTAAAALIMTHLSRLSEELILWMSPRFGFIDIADRFCTGSSIMPQKKNPDVPELVRGKTGRVNGHLVALLTLMKGQPLAYNKDNQEDKEPLFDTVDTLSNTLRIYADMMGGITVKPEAMRNAALQGYATATDLADYLVKKGLPFRDAHEAVALAVRFAVGRACDLSDLKLDELQQFSKLIENDIYAVLTLEGSLSSRNHTGGTAPQQVEAAIARARKYLAEV